jgi:hypothetical protein
MAFNLFEAPEYYQGLLGEEATKKLQNRALTTGLVNAAIGYLAQPKTGGYGSALPYIGRALAGGLQSGQETIRSGLQDYETQQKLSEMQRKQKEQKVREETLKDLSVTDPELYKIGTAFPGAVDQLVAARYKPQTKGFQILNEEQSKAYQLPKAPEGQAWQVTENGFNLVGKAEGAEKGFGSGVQGAALNYLVQGSGDNPEAVAFRSTPNYALAYREANKPTPVQVEEADAYGNVRQVTKMIAPPPLPKNILPPVFGTSQPSVSQPTSGAPRVATLANIETPTSSVTQRTATPTASNVTPTVATDNVYNVPSGIKSSPYTPSQTEIKDYRDKRNQAVRLQNTLKDMESFIAKNPDPALWGVGATGAKLQTKYEDALTQLRIASELGVLNKEDLPRLQAALPNPSDLSTWIKGGGTLDTFKGSLEAQNERLNRDIDFYNSYLNPQGSKQPTPSQAQDKPLIDLPMSGNTVNKLKLRNGMSYKRSDGSVIGTWNSKKQIFE